MRRKHRRNSIFNKPWGFAAAMLAASMATLVGTLMQLDPDVILWRASMSAVVMGLLTRGVLGSASLFTVNS